MFKLVFWILGLVIASTPILSRAAFTDPTKPDYAPSSSVIKKDETTVTDKLVLSAIWITENARWATINGITAKQGQTILKNIKIIKITKHTVSLQQDGNIKTLRLLKSLHKK